MRWWYVPVVLLAALLLVVLTVAGYRALRTVFTPVVFMVDESRSFLSMELHAEDADGIMMHRMLIENQLVGIDLTGFRHGGPGFITSGGHLTGYGAAGGGGIDNEPRAAGDNVGHRRPDPPADDNADSRWEAMKWQAIRELEENPPPRCRLVVKDVLPYARNGEHAVTADELERFRRVPSSLEAEILRRGRQIYG